jgi:alpha-tubulin suppressor-like RCC1 family protein
MVTWGFNREGQASLPQWSAGMRFKDIEAGSNWVVGLREDGRVVGWGKNDFGQLTIPSSAVNVDAISAYFGHVLALKRDGSVIGWGRNSEGQASVPRGLRNIRAVSAGHAHSLALTSDETVVGWGDAYTVQEEYLATLGGIKAISAGYDHSLALTNWGRVVCWQSRGPGVVDVGQCDPIYEQLYDIVAISAGKQYSLAMDKNGKVYGWGINTSGQARIPATLARAMVIEAGYVNSVVGYEDGSMRSFGDAAHGALQSRTPTRSMTRIP